MDILSIGASIRLISSSPLRLTQVRGSTISSFLTYRSNSFQEVKGIYMECQPVFFWIFLEVRSWKPAPLVRYLFWRNSPTAIIGEVFFARNISPVISVFVSNIPTFSLLCWQHRRGSQSVVKLTNLRR